MDIKALTEKIRQIETALSDIRRILEAGLPKQDSKPMMGAALMDNKKDVPSPVIDTKPKPISEPVKPTPPVVSPPITPAPVADKPKEIVKSEAPKVEPAPPQVKPVDKPAVPATTVPKPESPTVPAAPQPKPPAIESKPVETPPPAPVSTPTIPAPVATATTPTPSATAAPEHKPIEGGTSSSDTAAMPVLAAEGQEEVKVERVSPVGQIGVFEGEFVIMENGKKYQVPPNYASKSMLVIGDKLKLTKEGDYNEFKLVEEAPRATLSGILTKKNNQWVVLTDKGEFRVVSASIRFYNGEIGDKIELVVPANYETAGNSWGAVKQVVKLNPPKEGEEPLQPARKNYGNRSDGGYQQRDNRPSGDRDRVQQQALEVKPVPNTPAPVAPTPPPTVTSTAPVASAATPIIPAPKPTPAPQPAQTATPAPAHKFTPLAGPIDRHEPPALDPVVASFAPGSSVPAATPVAPAPMNGTPGTVIATDIAADQSDTGSSEEVELDIPELR